MPFILYAADNSSVIYLYLLATLSSYTIIAVLHLHDAAPAVHSVWHINLWLDTEDMETAALDCILHFDQGKNSQGESEKSNILL